MNNIRIGLYGAPLLLSAIGLTGCANSMTSTGVPGVKMGDSYEQVLAVVSRDNTVTKKIDGEGFRAEGYSQAFRDCRSTYFIFQGADGLQMVSHEPAPHLSVSQNCHQP